jgi:hypothetical protein
MRRYSGGRRNSGIGQDPYWTTAKFEGRCGFQGCDQVLRRGDRAFYYPNTRKILAVPCGHAEAASADFDSHRADEDNNRSL